MSKTAHWIFTGLTALVGIIQTFTPMIPPQYQGLAFLVLGGINGILHVTDGTGGTSQNPKL